MIQIGWRANLKTKFCIYFTQSTHSAKRTLEENYGKNIETEQL